MSTDAPNYICTVCDEPAAAPMTAECNWCNRRYHLNQRNDVAGRDCGQVWVDEQYLALQFACNTCLAGTDRDLAAPGTQVGQSSAPDGTAAARPAVNTRLRRYKRRA
jgi:hypothetical protein